MVVEKDLFRTENHELVELNPLDLDVRAFRGNLDDRFLSFEFLNPEYL